MKYLRRVALVVLGLAAYISAVVTREIVGIERGAMWPDA